MAKKKILLFGATGMAGHMIYFYLNHTDKYDITNVVFRTKLTKDSIILDITNKKAVTNLVRKEKPMLIINCVGVLIKGSNKHPDNAILINAYFPHLLKNIADEIGAKLIQISTDCVFSGKKGNYTEEDICDAEDIYGKSKSLGEIINDKDLTIRTSIIGPELKGNGEGLFHWFMNQKGDINGFRTAIWSGITTLELAKAINVAINKNSTGLIQLSNGIGITKYDLLLLFKEIWEIEDINILSYNGNGINKSIIQSQRFSYSIPSYKEMLIEQFIWMNNHPELYLRIYPTLYPHT